MKKVKGFTLVELIIVVAIFSLIMAAVLSILNPISSIYASTANYEYARASSDNVRLYVEDNLKYATALDVAYNVPNAGDAIAAEVLNKAESFIDSYRSDEDAVAHKGSIKYYVATDDNPLYIMKIANSDSGKITIYRTTSSDIKHFTKYKEINDNLYNNYSYEFNLPNTSANPLVNGDGDFNTKNAKIEIKIFKNFLKDGKKDETKPPEDTNLYNIATFSFVNINNGTSVGNIQDYIWVDKDTKVRVAEGTPNAVLERRPLTTQYKKCENLGSNPDDKDIYFIYTLPKFINELK